MPLKDILNRRSRDRDNEPPSSKPPQDPDEFTFMRSDTNTNEIISPPSFAGDYKDIPAQRDPPRSRPTSFLRFRASSNASSSSVVSNKSEKRLSQRLHLRRSSQSSNASSVHVPQDLPSISSVPAEGKNVEEQEAQWEERATLLAKGNVGSRPGTPGDVGSMSLKSGHGAAGRGKLKNVADPSGDETIQEAIRLHEAGDLARSTAMFGRLADPDGTDDALSQVLYGLALRHGWGVAPDPNLAVKYLSTAASHAADVESLALNAGMKKGGAAKGELVLAIFELANCFRNGWGVPKDAVAAKQYYETAANLGDTDACNEVAWCYLEGYGTRKDKFAAARYYRLAEQKGSKTLGNSWIWKDKYNPT